MSTDKAHGAHSAHVAHHFKDATQQYLSGKEGIWLFMLTEILMFGAIFVAYAIYHHAYPEMFAEGAKSLDWKMGFINTLVLIFSSFTMAISISFIQKNEQKKAVIALATTVLCGAIFMVIKYFEYTHKFHLGLFPGKFLDVAKVGAEHANLGLYFGFYYCMTGLHGIHVLLGMGLITWCLIRTMRGDFHGQYWIVVEGVGIFWHIVDLIWIFLFPLLYLVG
ncbi:cytochrome c oxidase subunit 3 family protein [Bdellovibrio sp. HCB2-146]|uniref:cytochrome c oxidase subunit 3 family protein n=1 Tax=Bdellovibrio sp. HCB2-146 TaxID=3394362 RepID=UPI0039BC6267